MNLKIIENELNKLVIKATKNEEVPVAAIIVKDNKIIARGYNRVNKTNNILNHAEILVIKSATKKLKNWRLNNCELYVTLEPCSMCKEIIRKSRIGKVYYFVAQNEDKTDKEPNYEYIKNDLFSKQLKEFFINKR